MRIVSNDIGIAREMTPAGRQFDRVPLKRVLHLLIQHRTGLFPVAKHRACGNASECGYFLNGVAAEVFEIDDLREPRILRGERIDGLGQLFELALYGTPTRASQRGARAQNR